MATSLENLASKTWAASFRESHILPPPRNEVETWESPRSHEETEATNKNSFWLILGVVSIAVK